MGNELFGWQFCTGKKRGNFVGLTRKGKGTKWMIVTDKRGTILSGMIASAGRSEVKLALQTIGGIAVETRPLHIKKRPKKLIADKGYDAGWLRKAIRRKGISPFIPKKRKAKQKEYPKYNERIKKYYRERWIVERTFAWLGWNRRLLVRWERNDRIYHAFFTLAIIMLCLKEVLK